MTPGNPFDDDISLLSVDGNSPLSEDGNSPHDKDSERPRERKLPQQSPGPSLSSLVSKLAVKTTSSKMTQQPRATQERVTSLSALRKTSGDETTSALASTAVRPMTRSQNNVRRKLKLRLPHLPNMNPNSDEISITDSLCSGVLREFANAKALARTTRSKIENDGHEDILRDIVGDDGHNDNGSEERGAPPSSERKERVRERLERYKRDHGQLRSTCMALESALAKTSEKLREVDSRAASKIEALESELRGAREGDETMRINQETCIKELGKKLIRQAHVIKKQRDAVERYKMQLEAMTEELAMQDERDMMREEDVRSA
ncbi:hypothetical protein ACHAW5_008048 [Stephanodiscus triporus]|uniref:Uncharacterized protein n=1 Tax=Stephanodiscus triporus TaxID=2934178 RepID=A0ABD3QG44_9STRA